MSISSFFKRIYSFFSLASNSNNSNNSAYYYAAISGSSSNNFWTPYCALYLANFFSFLDICWPYSYSAFSASLIYLSISSRSNLSRSSLSLRSYSYFSYYLRNYSALYLAFNSYAEFLFFGAAFYGYGCVSYFYVVVYFY